MGIITKYCCDKCGKEQDTYDQMWNVGISCVYVNPTYQQTYDRDLLHKQMWCRECVEVVGILPSHAPVKEQREHKPPSIEDMIREIARTAAEEAVNDNR